MNALQNISVAGENSLIVYFGDARTQIISEDIASEIAATAAQLRTSLGTQLIDLVASYASLLVIYDPFKTDHHAVRAAIRRALADPIDTDVSQSGALVTLPVYYSAESGPDL